MQDIRKTLILTILLVIYVAKFELQTLKIQLNQINFIN